MQEIQSTLGNLFDSLEKSLVDESENIFDSKAIEKPNVCISHASSNKEPALDGSSLFQFLNVLEPHHECVFWLSAIHCAAVGRLPSNVRYSLGSIPYVPFAYPQNWHFKSSTEIHMTPKQCHDLLCAVVMRLSMRKDGPLFPTNQSFQSIWCDHALWIEQVLSPILEADAELCGFYGIHLDKSKPIDNLFVDDNDDELLESIAESDSETKDGDATSTILMVIQLV